jgi:DNA-binding response OmpR family regulator
VRVLIAEDELGLIEVLRRRLTREGMAVDVATDGATALHQGRLHRYAVIVLDRDLPVIHGDEVCRRLRQEEPPPRILMLTAAAAVRDRVEGLALGADDYLVKPFALDELVARMRALARRPERALVVPLRHRDLELDGGARTVTRAGRDLELTRKEFAVLELLLEQPGRVVSTEELLERAWDANTDPFTNVVRVVMSGVRRKLGDPPLIETVIGVGYRLA